MEESNDGVRMIGVVVPNATTDRPKGIANHVRRDGQITYKEAGLTIGFVFDKESWEKYYGEGSWDARNA